MTLNPAEQEAWQVLLAAHGRVVTNLDAELVSSCDMTLAEYEVLYHLAADGPDERLRMNELAERARLSPSGLTRRFDSLVRRGWVMRERCDDDRRGVYARITPEGLTELDGARPVHDRTVADHVFQWLDQDDVDRLQRMLSKVAEAPTGQDVPF